MDSHALDVLEFKKIRKQLKQHTTSQLTIPLIEQISPGTDIEKISERQKEVTEAKRILIREDNPPLGHMTDIRAILKNAEKGITLSGEELFEILTPLKIARDAKKFFLELDDEEQEYQRIIDIAFRLENFKNLINKIEKTVDKQGNIKDSASKKLKNIRQKKRNLSSQIKNKLNSIINSNQYQKYIQENVVTIRNNRYVVPIKVEFKNEFPGIVHDQSSSGQTVFIEPMTIVELNNKLRQEISEEEEEIHRILVDITDRIKYQIDNLKATINILAVLDLIFTKARYSIELKASEPLLNEDSSTELIKARHPLLDQEEVVPIDINLGDEFKSLIITGPNTGGKTVTLKTFGLLTLMAQSGLHIPALSGSEIAIYEKIYSDIGDEQSIEQNLSTFSSHMTQIIKIIENANQNSLVLLDEIGAGTDPVEGSALAMSILNYLLEKKAKIIATTHYSELKNYAYGHEEVENASVEFDVETLQPTYKLQMGLPGRSNAFQIAERLGLKKEVIDMANSFLKKEDVELDNIIKEAEKDKQLYQDKKLAMEEDRKEAEKLKEEYQAKIEELEKRKEKELNQAYQKAEKIVKEAEKEAETVIDKLKKEATLSDRKVEEAKSDLREKRKAIKNDRNELVADETLEQTIPELEVGDEVLVERLNRQGEVLQLDYDKEEALVQAGAVKLNIDLKELSKNKEKDRHENKKSRRTNVSEIKGDKQRNLSTKLDLRGLRAQEAQKKLDKYLDDALLTNLNQSEIIHGKGSGVLRQVVHERLEKYSRNIDYRLGKPKEGGSGVTIVNFK